MQKSAESITLYRDNCSIYFLVTVSCIKPYSTTQYAEL